MTLDEVRKALSTAIWHRDVPLVTLFDDLVEHCDDIPIEGRYGETIHPKKVTGTFTSLTQPTTSSGEIVALVLNMRRDAEMKIHDVGFRK